MTDDRTRAALEALVAARNAGAPERVAQALSDDARYWDTEQGDVRGREAVVRALTGRGGRLEVDTAAVAGDDAVFELRVDEAGARYRATEVYRLQSGAVASIRAYYEPAERGAAGR